MSQIKTIFIDCINQGLEAVEALPVDKKPFALAEIAKALAMTGLINSNDKDNISMSEVKEELVNSTEGAPQSIVEQLSDEIPTEKENTEELPKEVQDDMATSEETINEWNDDTLEQFADEIENLSQIKEAYGEDVILDAIKDFTDNQVESYEDITPANIKFIVDMLLAQIQEAE